MPLRSVSPRSRAFLCGGFSVIDIHVWVAGVERSEPPADILIELNALGAHYVRPQPPSHNFSIFKTCGDSSRSQSSHQPDAMLLCQPRSFAVVVENEMATNRSTSI